MPDTFERDDLAAAPSVDDGGSVSAAVTQLAEDAKAYAAAQIALGKAIASSRWRVAKVGIALLAVAAVLAFATVGALLVGLILSLVPLVGPLAATAIVIAMTAVLAGLLGWIGARRLSTALGGEA